jgi:hypothetical protein
MPEEHHVKLADLVWYVVNIAVIDPGARIEQAVR